MLSITTLVSILFTHWIGDFILQDEQWAINKHKDNQLLTFHVLMYTGFWGVMLLLQGYDFKSVLLFCSITFFFHFLTDFVTSKITHIQHDVEWYGNAIPNFGMFTVIGFDQLLHYIQLILTYQYIYG